MNVDVRLQVGYLRHPKIVRLRAKLGDAAVLAVLEMWLYATQHASTDGVLALDAEQIEAVAGWNGEPGALVDELVHLGLLDEASHGLGVHNWELHNKWQAGEEARRERGRRGARARWDAAPDAQAMLKHSPSDAQANAQAMPRTVPCLRARDGKDAAPSGASPSREKAAAAVDECPWCHGPCDPEFEELHDARRELARRKAAKQ